MKSAHPLIHHLLTAGSHFHQEPHDGFLMHASHANNGADRAALGESRDNRELLFCFQHVHGTSLDGDPGRCIIRLTRPGCNPVRPSRDLPGCGCSVLVTPGNQSYLHDGGGGQPRTGDSWVSNPAFYPLNYPAIHLPLSFLTKAPPIFTIIYLTLNNMSIKIYNDGAKTYDNVWSNCRSAYKSNRY